MQAFLNLCNSKKNCNAHVLVLALFQMRVNAAVYPYLRSSIWGTSCDVSCLYSETRMMLKLERRARGHFVTLIEI